MPSRVALASIAAACLTLAPLRAQKGPVLSDILQSAANYLADTSRKLGAVETEEALTQRETSGGTFGTGHTWKAEVVLIGLGNGSIAAFRDVFEVEGSKARERDHRLFTLFQQDPHNAMVQAQTLNADSTRLALTPAMAVFNTPTLALEFLRRENQSRSTFKLDSVKTMNGVQVAILKFSEQGKTRLLQGTEDGTTQGRFWIEVPSGVVRQTELLFTTKSIDVRSTVTYASDPTIGLWLPASLDATYSLTGAGSGGAAAPGQAGDSQAYGSRQTIESQVNTHEVPAGAARSRRAEVTCFGLTDGSLWRDT